jgi:hypothetical protein
MFEGPPRKPELTEVQQRVAKERQALIARELRQHNAILEREIAELA